MPSYRVRFCNDLDDSTGHPFHPCQREITIQSAENEQAAIAAAKRLFEQQEEIGSWKAHASSIECEQIDDRG